MLYSSTRSLSILVVFLAAISANVVPSANAHALDLKRDSHSPRSPRVGLYRGSSRRHVTSFDEDGGNIAREPGQFSRPDWRRDVEGHGEVLEKRADNVRFTLYNAGLGACGAHNSNGDAIVAMSLQDWAGGAHCFDKVTIMAKGKSVQATIVDRCVECPSGALDLSPSLFAQFDDPNNGVFYGSWSYGSGAPEPKPEPKPSPIPEPKPEPKPSPSPSPSPSPKPSPTSTLQRTSSTSTREATSTRPSSTSTASSSSTTVSSSTVVAPAATVAADDPQVVNRFNIAMLQLGALAIAGATTSE
ncbi:hypothetical protein BDN71DRAFT_1511938 [Pleurotus eryngii]|uniref:RlpA-like protein double-psi beta-barrel domain-containing protein n=1 Tax=Pleurotus eryngii TaxID=5323 RepID=A0A9P5ZLD6_PLEER|nr:hypothetical protein BDN71DRAFT_1511938 [Pleurotus eryngii]